MAGIGVIGTLVAGISGVLITQRRSDRREDKAWAREKERWLREDETRTFDHRREAYVKCYEAIQILSKTAHDKGYGLIELEDGQMPDDWHSSAFKALQRLAVYGTPEVTELANKAYNAAWRWGYYGDYNAADSADSVRYEQDYSDAEVELLFAIRDDLSIPGGYLTTVP